MTFMNKLKKHSNKYLNQSNNNTNHFSRNQSVQKYMKYNNKKLRRFQIK